MTAATYTSDLVDISLFESTTGVSAYGGGGAGLGAGVDYAIIGNCVDKQITNAEKGFMFDNGSNFTIGADDHFFIWIMGATPGIIDTRDNRGIVVCVGDSTSAFVKFHVNGVDTLKRGGIQSYAVRYVNTTLTNLRTLVGSPGTTPSWIGGGLKTTDTSKSPNLGVDQARIGTGYDVLNGTGADPEANFAGIAADDATAAEGILIETGQGYDWKGKIRIGSASTACEFKDSNVSLALVETIHSLSDFTEMLVEHASSIVTLDRVNFKALDPTNTGRFEMLTSAATVDLTDCVFDATGVTVLGTGATLLRHTWIGCGVVTANGADISGSNLSGYEGTVATSPIIWDTATDPDGYLDDLSITKGTVAAHGIELGTTSPLAQTFRGITTSGYHASNGNDDSFFHVKRTSGNVTLNIIDGTGEFSYKSDGAIVTVVISPVTATINTIDSLDGTDIQSVRVLLWADAGGGLPADASVTSITRSGTVATVTTGTAHGLSTNDEVLIEGADQTDYNGPYTVTVTGGSTYTYTVANSPTQPATGTIVFSAVIVNNELTNASGVVTDTRTYGSDQPVQGWARKGTVEPLYQSTAISGTLNSGSDTILTIPMAPD